jgi:hypothetical protein
MLRCDMLWGIRVADSQPLAQLAAKARRDGGEAYCGGQIETLTAHPNLVATCELFPSGS